jgi:hypothetical protein
MVRKLPVVFALLVSSAVYAADHLDGPGVLTDPSADITDLFAWTAADGQHLNLVMNVFPAATTASKFSNTVQYVFHTSSTTAFGTAATSTEDIICTFDAAQAISCWAGTEYVNGNANVETGIASTSGKLRVFAGLRDDPFFFNEAGFKNEVSTVQSAASSLTFDAAGCPAIDASTSTALLNILTHGATSTAPAVDFFSGFNVLAIVLQVDLSIVNKGGPVVSVWGSTNRP